MLLPLNNVDCVAEGKHSLVFYFVIFLVTQHMFGVSAYVYGWEG